MKKIIFICFTMIMLSGCVSTRNYEGPVLPQSEVSEIYLVTIDSGVNLYVTSINNDGKEYYYYKRLSVLPGEKNITLRSDSLSNVDKKYDKTYMAKSTISFIAKKGKAYTFSTPNDYIGSGIRTDSKVCINEEDWDDPDALVGLTGEFRSPSKNSIKIACSEIKLIEKY
ncbi:hypothetical protein [Amphritea pacifica]|uniref:hypothetical protein n=1 Tax=Amphritea pacifica TaxID=2811233 RepID=UPI00196645B9|nr:hypothetical protein [Amphritea pacifica]MBN1005652.1 hypothetical protein [Amphritea pacifica]